MIDIVGYMMMSSLFVVWRLNNCYYCCGCSGRKMSFAWASRPKDPRERRYHPNYCWKRRQRQSSYDGLIVECFQIEILAVVAVVDCMKG